MALPLKKSQQLHFHIGCCGKDCSSSHWSKSSLQGTRNHQPQVHRHEMLKTVQHRLSLMTIASKQRTIDCRELWELGVNNSVTRLTGFMIHLDTTLAKPLALQSISTHAKNSHRLLMTVEKSQIQIALPTLNNDDLTQQHAIC